MASLRITMPIRRRRMKLTVSSSVMPTKRLCTIMLVTVGRWPRMPKMVIVKRRRENVSMAKSLLSWICMFVSVKIGGLKPGVMDGFRQKLCRSVI